MKCSDLGQGLRTVASEDASARAYWRSIEELVDSEAFQAMIQREFPEDASVWLDPVGRRRFLKLMAASIAFAGWGGCTRQPPESIVAPAESRERYIPGRPRFFATAMPGWLAAEPLLVESHEGRPTKIEGNPQHAASRGATSAFAQASILELYDPDRSQVIRQNGVISTPAAFQAALNNALVAQRKQGGKGFRILTGSTTSPTLLNQLGEVLRLYPEAKWYRYEPVNQDHARQGTKLAFGEGVDVRYRLDRADVILSLDADFLSCDPGSVAYSRDFAERRRVRADKADMNRLYAVEGTLSNTGASADHRLVVRPSRVREIARRFAAELRSGDGRVDSFDSAMEHWIAAVVRDLKRSGPAGLVIAGMVQPPVVHALTCVMNDALGAAGQTVEYTESIDPHPMDSLEAISTLAKEMAGGKVEVLLVLGSNPVYSAPADVEFASHLRGVGFRVHLGTHYDETAEQCEWHVPQAHYLESWSDARAFDGTVSIVQPLIAPLYGGRTAHELLSVLLDNPGRSSHAIVRDYWRGKLGDENFDSDWHQALHDGFLAGTKFEARTVRVEPKAIQRILSMPLRASEEDDQSLFEAVISPDPAIWDGRYANNAWLQELPRPLTKLTWDNAALISPNSARELGVENEDVIELASADGVIRAPVWIVPGHADRCVSLHLGYGRRRAGSVGSNIGVDVNALRSTKTPWLIEDVQVSRTLDRYPLACTQNHHAMEGRDLVRSATLASFKQDAHGRANGRHAKEHSLSLYPDYQYDGRAWGMVIDLNACNGCNACVVACQAENNIPVVGKDQVRRGREMHWLRVDRYFRGSEAAPDEICFQPLPCMHCERAPCEIVCPVVATTHSGEGLNEMIYNRCVGTRYCSNNCPYKVRRFNFLQYAQMESPSLRLMQNPDVTVRSRGVMEKCTYCVQRISAARIEAKKENRPIRDGEVVTACQQVCPTQAIVFGDLNDADSQVARLCAQPHNYGLLTHLNTQPRTTYLARFTNPNPELSTSEA